MEAPSSSSSTRATHSVVFVVDSTMNMNPTEYIKLLRTCVFPMVNALAKNAIPEFILVMYRDYPPFAKFLTRHTAWTSKCDKLLGYMNAVTFGEGGLRNTAAADGLGAALHMCSSRPSMRKSIVLITGTEPMLTPSRYYGGLNYAEQVNRIVEGRITFSILSPRAVSANLKGLFTQAAKVLNTSTTWYSGLKMPEDVNVLICGLPGDNANAIIASTTTASTTASSTATTATTTASSTASTATTATATATTATTAAASIQQPRQTMHWEGTLSWIIHPPSEIMCRVRAYLLRPGDLGTWPKHLRVSGIVSPQTISDGVKHNMRSAPWVYFLACDESHAATYFSIYSQLNVKQPAYAVVQLVDKTMLCIPEKEHKKIYGVVMDKMREGQSGGAAPM